MTLLRFKCLTTPIGPLRVVVGGLGICRLTFPNLSGEAWRAWFDKHYGQQPVEAEHSLLEQALEQLERYFEGDLARFELPLELHGTRFQQLVWRTLLEIPPGHTWSYGDVAAHIGSPLATQAVGAAVGANPVPVIVPCHRVVGADGELVGFGGGLDTKEWLLRHEGALSAAGQLELWDSAKRPEKMRKKTHSAETKPSSARRALTEDLKGVL